MNTEEMIEAVRDWLDADDWKYDFKPDRNIIELGVNLKSKLKSTDIFIDFKESSYVVYAIAPLQVDEEQRMEVAKYLTMANYGLLLGNFEMDFRDGEVRYKAYVNCSDLDAISDEIVRASICVPCAMYDRYGNGLAAIIMGFSDADTEIEKADRPQ